MYGQVNTERAIRHAIQERLPIVVVINKVFYQYIQCYRILIFAFYINSPLTGSAVCALLFKSIYCCIFCRLIG